MCQSTNFAEMKRGMQLCRESAEIIPSDPRKRDPKIVTGSRFQGFLPVFPFQANHVKHIQFSTTFFTLY